MKSTVCVSFGIVVAACGGAPSASAPPSAGGARSAKPSVSCAETWATPTTVTSARTRPVGDAIGLEIHYSVAANGRGVVDLHRVRGVDQIALPSDGPFAPGEHAGAWLELRDASGQTLYTRSLHELIPEATETHDASGASNVDRCPTSGIVVVPALPNRADAATVVLFQEPIDGTTTHEAVEFARLDLP